MAQQKTKLGEEITNIVGTTEPYQDGGFLIQQKTLTHSNNPSRAVSREKK